MTSEIHTGKDLIQEIIVIALLIAAVGYIAFKIYKTIAKKNCQNGDCNCK